MLSNAVVDAPFTAPGVSVWLGLRNGTIEQRLPNGTTVVHNNFPGSRYVAMSATCDSDVRAVTPEGGALHFDGTKWSTSIVPLSTGTSARGIEAATTTTWVWSSNALFKWSGSTWSAVTTPGTSSSTPQNVVVTNDQPWAFTNSSSSAPYNLFSLTNGTWKLRRSSNSGSVLLARAATGVLTLAYWSENSAKLERWTDTAVSTITTLVDAQGLGGGTCLAMPSTTRFTYGSSQGVSLSEF